MALAPAICILKTSRVPVHSLLPSPSPTQPDPAEEVLDLSVLSYLKTEHCVGHPSAPSSWQYALMHAELT
jgi:hypothetical protein